MVAWVMKHFQILNGPPIVLSENSVLSSPCTIPVTSLPVPHPFVFKLSILTLIKAVHVRKSGKHFQTDGVPVHATLIWQWVLVCRT